MIHGHPEGGQLARRDGPGGRRVVRRGATRADELQHVPAVGHGYAIDLAVPDERLRTGPDSGDRPGPGEDPARAPDLQDERIEGTVSGPGNLDGIRLAIAVRGDQANPAGADFVAVQERRDSGGVDRASSLDVGCGRRADGDPQAALDLGHRRPLMHRAGDLVPGVAVRDDRARRKGQGVAGVHGRHDGRRGSGRGPQLQPVDRHDPEATDGQRGTRRGRGNAPGGDVAVAVVTANPEGVGVAVRAEIDGAAGRRARQEARPGPPIGRCLDVIGHDRAVVATDPMDVEAGVVLGRREGADAHGRRRRVVEELVGERLVQLRPRAVVAESPDSGASQGRPVDQVVAQLQRSCIVVVELAPGGHAAVGRRAGLLLVLRPGRLLDAVVQPTVLGGQAGRGGVHGRDRAAVLRAGDVCRMERRRVRRPRSSVVRHPQDQLRRRDARGIRGNRVDQVVWRSAERADGARVRGRGPSVVVAHDEDRVGPARRRRRLQRVVADVAGRVEGQLIAGRDRVEIGAKGSDEGRELIRVARGDRLEVQVDPVRASLGDRGCDLRRQVRPSRGAAEEGRLGCRLPARPGEDRDGQDHPGPVLMRGIDDRGHPGARPAAPAGRHAAARVLLQEVAVLVGPDAEVGDGREDGPVEGGR